MRKNFSITGILVIPILRKLEQDDKEDYEIMMRLVANRQPISQKLGVYNDIWPLLVYCFYEYKVDLYYLVDEDVVVISRREDGRLHIYDVISLKPIDLDSIIEKIVMESDEMIEFHFIPEGCKYKITKGFNEKQNDTLFVWSKNTIFKEILFPNTSHT